MKEIQLTKGYVALVDDEDFEMISRFKWYVRVEKRTAYAQTNIYSFENGKRKQLTQMMHRLILGVTDRKVDVDHINHNGLDNRRKNIRAATRSQNQRNRIVADLNSTGYKGVEWSKQSCKYKASFTYLGKRTRLGYFDCPIEAARHYNRAAKQHGEGFELLNNVEPLFPTVEYVSYKEIRTKRRNDNRLRSEQYDLDRINGNLKATYPGVTFEKHVGKWRVRLGKKSMGLFMTQDEAIAARDVAIKKSE